MHIHTKAFLSVGHMCNDCEQTMVNVNFMSTIQLDKFTGDSYIYS